MDTLIELINIVNRKRLSKIDVLDKTFLNKKSKDLYYQLYTAIETKQVLTDDEGGKLLYGTGRDDARFRMLKSRLKSKILNTFFLIEPTNFTNNKIGIAYYECKKHNQIVDMIVKMTGTTKLVYELIKEDYAKALKYKFYGILKNYSYLLIAYYSLKGDEKSLLAEDKRYVFYVELSHKEQFAKYLYNKAVVNFVNNTSITNELITNVKVKLDQLYKLKMELDNIEITFQYYYLALIYYEYNREMNQILKICDEADNLINNKPEIITYTRKSVILLYRLKALLFLKQFNKGITLLKNSIDVIAPETNYNWFVLKETEFKLYLQDNKITGATDVYQQVINNKSFKRQVVQLTEKWKIYHAYLVFMDNYLSKGDFKFSVSKFLNDVPVNSKDKSGYNFAIRVIEILFLFANKKYNHVFQKMQGLHVYRTRYLNDNTYKRNHLFLTLLLKAEKTGFKGKEMQNAGWKEIEELRKQNTYIIADWEIIPYEVLWDILIDVTKK